MYIPNDNSESTKMRWDGCFVRINGVITYITNVLELTPSHLKYQGAQINDYFWQDKEEKVPLALVEYSFPPLGNLNIRESVFFVRKSTNVSRKLGLHNERVMCFNLTNMSTVEIGIPILNALLNRKYYSAEEALSRVQKQIPSALSPYISITCVGGGKCPVRRGVDLIGILKKGKVYLTKGNKLFSQELTELGLIVQVEET